MTRSNYIHQTMARRMSADGSIILPLFVRAEQLAKQPGACRFGWVPPKRQTVIMLGNAPRYIVMVSPEVIAEQTYQLNHDDFTAYIDALILYFILIHLHLTRGADDEQAETNAAMEMLDKHKDLYGAMTNAQFSINESV